MLRRRGAVYHAVPMIMMIGIQVVLIVLQQFAVELKISFQRLQFYATLSCRLLHGLWPCSHQVFAQWLSKCCPGSPPAPWSIRTKILLQQPLAMWELLHKCIKGRGPHAATYHLQVPVRSGPLFPVGPSAPLTLPSLRDRFREGTSLRCLPFQPATGRKQLGWAWSQGVLH